MPKYNVEVKSATYKPMEENKDFTQVFTWQTSDIATALTGYLTAEMDQ